jgi:hypothetical protein
MQVPLEKRTLALRRALFPASKIASFFESGDASIPPAGPGKAIARDNAHEGETGR